MLLQKILSTPNVNENLIDNNKIFTYFSQEVSSNGQTVPVLKYYTANGKTGTIGTEQLKNKIISTSSSSSQTEINTRYICTGSSNLVITFPTADTKQLNQVIEVVNETDGKIITVSFTNSAGIATTVKLDEYNNKALFVKDTNGWTYYEPFKANDSYYHETTLTTDITATNHTRYLVTATGRVITLPTTVNNNNFQIAVSFECIATGTVTIATGGYGTIQYKTQTGLTSITLNSNSSKCFELVWNTGKNCFVVVNELSDNWTVDYISSNTTAEVGHKYVCQSSTGLTVTLPTSNVPTNGRTSVFIEAGLGTNKYVSVVTNGSGSSKNIQFGSSSVESIELPCQLIYVEFAFDGTMWHVVDLSMPNSGNKLVADGTTITETNDTISVSNIKSRLSGGTGITLSDVTGGITQINATQYGSGDYINVVDGADGKIINCTLSADNSTTQINSNVISVYSINSKLSAGTGLSKGLGANGVTTIGLDTSTAGTNQVLKFDGSKVVWANDNQGNTYYADGSTIKMTGTTFSIIHPSAAINTAASYNSSKDYVLVCRGGVIKWVEEA